MARIVFDLDGTLVDSAPDLHAIANDLLLAGGHAPVTLDEARSFIGQGVGVFVAKMRAQRRIGDDMQAPLLAGFMARYETAIHMTHPYPLVLETLQTLRRSGHRLGLCTNKPMAPTVALLQHLRLDKTFTTIIAGDSLPTRKPNPAPLIAAFEMPGPGPNLYVGDSEVDAETAFRAKVPLLLFTQGYRTASLDELPHEASFDSFGALPDLIAELDLPS